MAILLEMQQYFCNIFKTAFKQNGIWESLQQNMFLNIDETAIYFENKPTRTVHPAGCNNVVLRGSESSNHRMNACIIDASEGANLPFFVNYKGQPMVQLEKHISKIIQNGVYGCCQSKGWMDQRGLKIRIEKIWNHFVRNALQSLLLLDDFICHKHPMTVDLLQEVGTDTA